MTEPVTDPNPPEWAETVLRLFLKPGDRDSVSGDLLEEYRETVHAGRERVVADRWYVRQVAGFVWRATWVWAAVLAALTLGRSALDWFLPPASFYTRSMVTTYSHMGVFAAVGFRAVWRGQSLSGAAAAALGAQVIAVPMIFAGTVGLIGLWHDPQTLGAIEHSGGIGELFTLPLAVTGPAVLLSILGGGVGLILGRSR